MMKPVFLSRTLISPKSRSCHKLPGVAALGFEPGSDSLEKSFNPPFGYVMKKSYQRSIQKRNQKDKG